VVFPEAPLPQALAAPPVFGGEPSEVVPAAPVGAAVALRRVRRTVRGRAFAYVVAAACLALAVGVFVHSQTLRPTILFQSVGPTIRLVTGGSETPQPARVPDGRQQSLDSSTQVASLRSASIGQQERVPEPSAGRVVDDGGAPSTDTAENFPNDGGARQPGAGEETPAASGDETAAAAGEDAAAAAGDGRAQSEAGDGRDRKDGRDCKDGRDGDRRDSRDTRRDDGRDSRDTRRDDGRDGKDRRDHAAKARRDGDGDGRREVKGSRDGRDHGRRSRDGGRRVFSTRHGGDRDRSVSRERRDRSRHQGRAASGTRRGKND
jgi:hypothetical protein